MSLWKTDYRNLDLITVSDRSLKNQCQGKDSGYIFCAVFCSILRESWHTKTTRTRGHTRDSIAKSIPEFICSSATVRLAAEPSVFQHICRAIGTSTACNRNWISNICTIPVEVFSWSTSCILTICKKWVAGVYIYSISSSKYLFTEELADWKKDKDM